jgi:hypothetical protein
MGNSTIDAFVKAMPKELTWGSNIDFEIPSATMNEIEWANVLLRRYRSYEKNSKKFRLPKIKDSDIKSYDMVAGTDRVIDLSGIPKKETAHFKAGVYALQYTVKLKDKAAFSSYKDYFGLTRAPKT